MWRKIINLGRSSVNDGAGEPTTGTVSSPPTQHDGGAQAHDDVQAHESGAVLSRPHNAVADPDAGLDDNEDVHAPPGIVRISNRGEVRVPQGNDHGPPISHRPRDPRGGGRHVPGPPVQIVGVRAHQRPPPAGGRGGYELGEGGYELQRGNEAGLVAHVDQMELMQLNVDMEAPFGSRVKQEGNWPRESEPDGPMCFWACNQRAGDGGTRGSGGGRGRGRGRHSAPANNVRPDDVPPLETLSQRRARQAPPGNTTNESRGPSVVHAPQRGYEGGQPGIAAPGRYDRGLPGIGAARGYEPGPPVVGAPGYIGGPPHVPAPGYERAPWGYEPGGTSVMPPPPGYHQRGYDPGHNPRGPAFVHAPPGGYAPGSSGIGAPAGGGPPGYDRGPPHVPAPGYDPRGAGFVHAPPRGYDRGWAEIGAPAGGCPPGYERGPPHVPAPGYDPRGAGFVHAPPRGYDRGWAEIGAPAGGGPPGYERGPPHVPAPGYDPRGAGFVHAPPRGYDRGWAEIGAPAGGGPPGYERGPPHVPAPGYDPRGAAFAHAPPGGYDRRARKPSSLPPSHRTPERNVSRSMANMNITPPASSGRRKMRRSDTGRCVAAAASSTATAAVREGGAAPMSSAAFTALVPDWLHTMDDRWELVECRAVRDGEEVGYLRALNGAETKALYGRDGVVSKRIPLSQTKETRKLRPGADPNQKQRVKNVMGFETESIRTVYCGAKGCRCRGKIYRLQNSAMSMKGLLYYEEINGKTNRIFEHENHEQPRLNVQGDETVRSRYTAFSLSAAQKEHIINHSEGAKLANNQLRDLVFDMIDSDDVPTTPAQDDDAEQFIKAAQQFVYDHSRSKTDHSHFGKQKMDDKTSAPGLRMILDHLQSEAESEERERKFTRAEKTTTPYLISSEFRQTRKLIKVHAHDHDGRTWSFITFEYLFAQALADKAVTMFPDKKVQLELDFFLSVCDGNEWQVGHIGFSDRGHKYWILAVVIAKSENHTAAGLLIDRALQLLRQAGGDGIYALVDGGKALEKAIGLENKSRVNRLKDAANEPDGNELSEQDNRLLSDAAAAIAEAQANEDAMNDPTARKALEERLIELLDEYTLAKVRCLAHMLRNMGRGGGFRGPKGSLCRALLNSGVCSKPMMRKILGIVFMISKVPCGDRTTFDVALEGLLDQYGDNHINDYVRGAYFNGEPRDLGGCCCHRPGEMMSTQGCEKRGGEVKTSHSQVLGHYCDEDKDVLGKTNISFQWYWPTASRLLTSVRLLKENLIQKLSGGVSEFQGELPNPEQLTDIIELNRMLTALPANERKELKQDLTKNRLANTSARKPGESNVMYLFRRAHRDAAEDALTSPYDTDRKKAAKKGNKKKANEKRIDEVVEERLALDKDAGEAEVVSQGVTTRATDSAKYQGDSVQIDGAGGVLEAAVTAGEESEAGNDDEEVGPKRETIRKRIRVKRELGDWIETKYVPSDDGSSCCVSCNCERYNYWGYCRHCLFVEVVHCQRFPTGFGNEQWQRRHEKILHNLKVQCGKLR